MASPWEIIETSPEAAAALSWRRWLGPAFQAVAAVCLRETRRTVDRIPCDQGCACNHRVCRRGTALVGVCDCGEECDDVPLTEAEVKVWEVDLARLGRAVVKALGCEAREASLGMRSARQVGSFGAAALPVVLAISDGREQLRGVMMELVARLRERFVVLTPTSQFWDARTKELLEGAKAGVFDLESRVTLMESGALVARQSGGKLFSRLLPEQEEMVSEQAMRQAYARLLLAFDGEKPGRKGTLKSVFDAYCRKGLSADDSALKCKCSKATVILRLAELKRITGVPANELRTYLHFFERVDESLRDRRARRIQRDAQTDGLEDNDLEN